MGTGGPGGCREYTASAARRAYRDNFTGEHRLNERPDWSIASLNSQWQSRRSSGSTPYFSGILYSIFLPFATAIPSRCNLAIRSFTTAGEISFPSSVARWRSSVLLVVGRLLGWSRRFSIARNQGSGFATFFGCGAMAFAFCLAGCALGEGFLSAVDTGLAAAAFFGRAFLTIGSGEAAASVASSTESSSRTLPTLAAPYPRPRTSPSTTS